MAFTSHHVPTEPTASDPMVFDRPSDPMVFDPNEIPTSSGRRKARVEALSSRERWMLIIIDPDKDIVWFLDPVNSDLRDEIGHTIFQ
ncbi:hypothetical protein PanWU01x14_063790 [Parasponia andersonii]|uniref:Uncharacterized protein n=1 Tax=Parasponia andersonii TaxID=3476 RepID=A0A2P5DH84_PARAD|nr:hypothetical protein PanWU01x14_063790 [Parasponia andersonii]